MGYCDYIFSASPEQYSLRAPLLMIIEAKNEDITGGFGQCIAEMVAAQIFNAKLGNGIETIYGAVTMGNNWRFLKLIGQTVYIDLAEYHISQIGKLLRILLHILQSHEVALAAAA